MKEEPPPSNLDGHGADGGATGLGDALVEGVISALIGGGREAGEAGDLTTVLDVAPGEELEGEEPGGLESDTLEAHELAYELECGIMRRGLEALALELLDEADSVGDIATVEPLTFETLAELGKKRRVVEEAQVVELVEEATIEGREGEALGSEEVKSRFVCKSGGSSSPSARLLGRPPVSGGVRGRGNAGRPRRVWS